MHLCSFIREDNQHKLDIRKLYFSPTDSTDFHGGNEIKNKYKSQQYNYTNIENRENQWELSLYRTHVK